MILLAATGASAYAPLYDLYTAHARQVRWEGLGYILLAISGTVFVVTAGRGFYDPGRPPELEHDYVSKMVNGKRLKPSRHRFTSCYKLDDT